MGIRKRRWLRRLAIGLSFALFAAPAAAKPYDGDGPVFDSQQAATASPDNRADRFTVGQETQFTGSPVRPDDRADRFAISETASPVAASSTNASVSWDGAVTLGIGALVLVLALGLGLGYIRRPRIAGL